MPHPEEGAKCLGGGVPSFATSWIIYTFLPCPPQTSQLRDAHVLIAVCCHRSGGLVRHVRISSTKTVEYHLEFLGIVVQRLVEEVRAGIHRLPDPGRPNQHTPLWLKVGPTVRAGPRGYIALDDLPHSIHRTVYKNVLRKILYRISRVRPSLLRGEHHQHGRCFTGLLHSVILFDSVVSFLVRP
ncbi:putative retrotransposon hot spot (RHS) protein [Trypanosoma cruzi]|nr:putative retrotransposon hot spot (RHS) protein [Trypanosoma cruzi]